MFECKIRSVLLLLLKMFFFIHYTLFDNVFLSSEIKVNELENMMINDVLVIVFLLYMYVCKYDLYYIFVKFNHS